MTKAQEIWAAISSILTAVVLACCLTPLLRQFIDWSHPSFAELLVVDKYSIADARGFESGGRGDDRLEISLLDGTQLRYLSSDLNYKRVRRALYSPVDSYLWIAKGVDETTIYQVAWGDQIIVSFAERLAEIDYSRHKGAMNLSIIIGVVSGIILFFGYHVRRFCRMAPAPD